MPEREFAIPLSNFTGTLASLRTYTGGVQWTTTQSGVAFATPFFLPIDFDPSFPCYVSAFIHNPSGPAAGGPFAVTWLLGLARWPSSGSGVVESLLTYDFPVPTAWPGFAYLKMLVDNGSALTFPANTFVPGDLVGLRFSRSGGAANDTYPNLVQSALALYLRYRVLSGAGVPCFINQ